MDRLMVVADDVESDVSLEFAQREGRMPTRIVLSELIRIAECRAAEQMQLPHLCPDQALDVPSEARLAGRPPVNLDAGILAATLECTAAEVATVVDMKAIKTIFLCRYLHDEGLRREINDGLNVIEHWNSANDFVFFARRGELSSNKTENQELSMLSLHLLQNCMVFVNTLMLQQVLSRPHWAGRLNARDLHALTPLIWEHVNPYGRFELDMDTRITALV